MIRPTLELGDPLLRQVAAPVEDARGETTQSLIADLRDTLRDFRERNGWGRALGAPVIGVPLRVVVVDDNDTSLVFINPCFESWSNDQVSVYESCICFPSLWGCVDRPRAVTITAEDEAGVNRRWEFEGDLARILQHEIDHLDGFVWLDRDPPIESICTTKEYQRRYRSR